MSTQSKSVFLILIAVMNLCQISGQIRAEDPVDNSTTKSEQPIKQPVKRPFITHDARVDEHVITLRKETFKESVAMLVSLDMYHYPIWPSTAAISLGDFQSFDPKHDKRTIDHIFSNRRFLKVLAESQVQTGSSGAVLRDG
ncbi:MAG: hypothetical protein JKY95_11215 [Planctomycetaceae bacterium]|nr:hypothetical protein [Planctomycetaceae bacterium]